MIWLVLVGAFALLFWYNLIRPLNYFKKQGIQQGNPWPILGDQWKTTFRLQSFVDFLKENYDRFSKVRYGGLYQFSVPTLMIKDPELIKQMAIKDFDHFTDHRQFMDPEIDPLWTKNLFSLRGQKWREMRATLSGSFTSSKMKNMFNLINDAAEDFVTFFKNHHQDVIEVELKDSFTRFTNDVIATTAFGIKVDSLNEPNNLFYKNGRKITNFSGFVTVIKFFASFLIPSVCKMFKISIFDRKVTEFFRKIIHETIETREKQHIVRQDMINQLLETRKGVKDEEVDTTETGFATVTETDLSQFKQLRTLSNDDITSQALIFFFAGFDTVSTALCFGSYELATNKLIQDKLREEIMETHKNNNGKLNYETLLKMKYMDMVISEMLRKWPPAIFVDRICTKPYTIQPANPEEKPVNLKTGDLIWYPIHGLHRDPEYYPEPNKFNPERFSDENKDRIRPYTYLPFGVGPRNCIGSRFALLEVKALMYNLLLNFEIVPTAKTQIPLRLSKKSFNHTAEGGFCLGLKRVK